MAEPAERIPAPAMARDAARERSAERHEALERRAEVEAELGHRAMLNGRPALAAQRKSAERLAGRPAGSRPVQRAPNRTGLPDRLKSGVEALSGVSMDGVKVHYNSSGPAQLGAHAFAQGSDIHLAPGQERHLPHEAWHVVQQAQGRVKPTLQAKGIAINDERGLEGEADAMGARAVRLGAAPEVGRKPPRQSGAEPVLQAYWDYDGTNWRQNGTAPLDWVRPPGSFLPMSREEFASSEHSDKLPALPPALASSSLASSAPHSASAYPAAAGSYADSGSSSAVLPPARSEAQFADEAMASQAPELGPKPKSPHEKLEEIKEIKALADKIMADYPPAEFHYLGLGKSPTPVIAFLQAYGEKTKIKIDATNMPLSKFAHVTPDMSRDQRGFAGGKQLDPEQLRRLTDHFDQFVPSADDLGGKAILLIDLTESGKSLFAAGRHLKAYLRDKYEEKNPFYQLLRSCCGAGVPKVPKVETLPLVLEQQQADSGTIKTMKAFGLKERAMAVPGDLNEEGSLAANIGKMGTYKPRAEYPDDFIISAPAKPTTAGIKRGAEYDTLMQDFSKFIRDDGTLFDLINGAQSSGKVGEIVGAAANSDHLGPGLDPGLGDDQEEMREIRPADRHDRALGDEEDDQQ